MSYDDRKEPGEPRTLEEVPRALDPPPALEEAVVARLRADGRLADRGRGWRDASRPWLAAAATVAALGVGFWGGRATATGTPSPAGAQFVLALYEGPEFEPFTDENYAERYEDYNGWVADLRRSGAFVDGLDLTSEGIMVVPGASGATATERLPESSDGWMDGMFLIAAADYDEAVRIAEGSPHVRYGGRVSVRRIAPLTGPERGPA